jgi:RNA polymerase primary sigma factor
MVTNKRYIDTSEESISHYLKEVRKIPMLSPEEEVEVTKKAAEGDRRAIERLINANLRFVISIAKNYQGQGIPLVDLINEGNFGLIKAAEKFDHTRGFRFISYAVWWVKQSILQSLNDHSRTVRLPVNITNQIAEVKKEMAKFEQENQRQAVVGDTVFDKNGNLLDLNVLNHTTCGSLNEKINEDGDEIMDVVADESFGRPDEQVLGEEVLKSELDKTMSILNQREKDIIQMYFGMDGNPMTLEQIGDEYGLTKERIRQIKEKALRKLKGNCENLFEFVYK